MLMIRRAKWLPDSTYTKSRISFGMTRENEIYITATDSLMNGIGERVLHTKIVAQCLLRDHIDNPTNSSLAAFLLKLEQRDKNTQDRRELMRKICHRLNDNGFETGPRFIDTVPVYEKLKDGKRIEFVVVEVANDDGLPTESSKIRIEKYDGEMHALKHEVSARDYIKGLGPKPVTHIIRTAANQLMKLTHAA